MKKWPDFSVSTGKAKKRGGGSYTQVVATAATEMPCGDGISARARAEIAKVESAKTQAITKLTAEAKNHLRAHGCDK